MSERDWLIVAGVVALVLIVIDGVRRMRNRNRLRLDIDNHYQGLPEEDFHGELPNGGARRVAASVEVKPSEPLSTLAEAAPAAEDIDLLLDGEFKGVGQGADRWLSTQGIDASTTTAKAPPRADQIDPLASVSVDRGPAVEEKREEPVLSVSDAPSDEVDPDYSIGSAQADELKQRLRESQAVEHGAAQPASWLAESTDNDSRDRVDPARASSGPPTAASDDHPAVSLPAVDDTDGQRIAGQAVSPEVGLSLVDAQCPSAQDLDFSQPVTVLMQQMKQRDAGGETGSVQEPWDLSLEDASDNTEDQREQQPGQQSCLPISEASAPVGDDLLTGADDEMIDAESGLCASREDRFEGRGESGTGDAKADARKAVEAAAQEAESRVDKPLKKSRISRLKEEIQINLFDTFPDLAPDPEIEAQLAAEAKNKSTKRAKQKTLEQPTSSLRSEPPAADGAEVPTPPPILVINVAGRSVLPGRPLVTLLEACGMEFGEMNIFYRHEDGPSMGAVQFRLANAVKPGHFDLDTLDTFETPAVTFFLDMSEPKELMNAFDCMLATAQCVADNLDAVLKDENRSVMRSQTIEHCRQQIRDFERRRLAKRA